MTSTQLQPSGARSLAGGGFIDRAVVRLTLGGLLGRRRALLLLVLPVLLLVLAVAARLFGVSTDGSRDLLDGFGLGTLLPLVALIVGTGVIAPEIDDGSIIYLLAKPVPRLRIVTSKLVVASGAAIAFAAVPILIAGLLLTGTDRGYAVAFGVAVALAAVAYSALFLLLGVVSRHPVVFGLLYIFLWESLGRVVTGVGLLSVQQWALSVAKALAEEGAIVAEVALPIALVMLVVVTIASTWYAGRRLRAFSLTGDE